MTLFSGKTSETLCGGQVNYSVNPKASSVVAVFKNHTPAPAICGACEFRALCMELSSAQTPPSQTQTQPHPNTQSSKKVLVRAFSGMPIGELPIIKETSSIIEVVTKKGIHLKFSKTTGEQVNAKDKRFANRIDIA